MKNLIYKITVLALLFTFSSSVTSNAQSNTKANESTFEMSFKNPTTSQKFKANISSIVINHEEQYGFAKFKEAVNKNKSLTFITKNLPTNSFKPGSTFDKILFAKKGKSLQLKNVKVVKNQSKGKQMEIKLSYKGVK